MAAAAPTPADRGQISTPVRKSEWAIFAAVLAVCNLPLLWGEPWAGFVFRPDRVAAGEWWRVFLHPFVHVSWYHLILDGAAFVCLYGSLPAAARWRNSLLVAGSGLGALTASLMLSPAVYVVGLCGLSGIDHGLMAVLGLEVAVAGDRELPTRIAGAACCATVFLKAVVETAMGGVLFAGLHLGALGHPVPACHLGGVLGAVAVWAVVRSTGRRLPGTVFGSGSPA